jgi:hypothetical protein
MQGVTWHPTPHHPHSSPRGALTDQHTHVLFQLQPAQLVEALPRYYGLQTGNHLVQEQVDQRVEVVEREEGLEPADVE